MANLRNTMIWMKDLIDHMADCHDQLQWASDGAARAFLAESLLVDLNQCRQLCEQLRQSQNPKSRESHASFDSTAPASSTDVSFRGSLVLS